ncbi:MAG TPA: hypothetical protein VFV11_08825 [Solimonas sp.]|nr:hypothetical protein [Solimonas sp.]
MARLAYLLDLPVLAELTRPTGNRRVLNLFQQHQALCAVAAPVAGSLLRGVESLHEGPRRTQLTAFVAELLRSGPPVLPFDREAAIWLAREAQRRQRLARPWRTLEGQQAAIAATRELVLVTQRTGHYAGAEGLRCEDWFRPGA